MLLVVTASQFAWLAPLRLAVPLVVAQTVVVLSTAGWRGDWSPLELMFNAGIYLGFQLFALFTSYTALKEAEGRAQLAQLNTELHTAQALLAESSRLSERLRIARELHDLIGHHLTALSLNLEVASHLTDGKAKNAYRDLAGARQRTPQRCARGGGVACARAASSFRARSRFSSAISPN